MKRRNFRYNSQPLVMKALIATATGLCVTIFALLVHTYFAQKLELTINLVLSKVGGKNEMP